MSDYLTGGCQCGAVRFRVEGPVRLATICNVRLLDPGMVERVLANDASVCVTSNALAFEKLRNVLMMHYAVRTRAADQIRQAGTNALVMQIVEELKKKFGDRLGTPPGSK